MTDNFQLISLKAHSDNRGSLIAIEDTVFDSSKFKRIYYIFDVKSSSISRGFHAHKKLEQLIIAVAGSCTFSINDGNKTTDVKLNSPTLGLWIKRPVWREIRDTSSDTVLMILASEYYDPDDYIHDYGEFLQHLKYID